MEAVAKASFISRKLVYESESVGCIEWFDMYAVPMHCSCHNVSQTAIPHSPRKAILACITQRPASVKQVEMP